MVVGIVDVRIGVVLLVLVLLQLLSGWSRADAIATLLIELVLVLSLLWAGYLYLLS